MADGVPFGSYRLQRRLARGGMAEVFLARLVGVEGFERRVAIKRILPHLSESEEFRVMFLDEARLAAQLTHPNIVHIYDFGKVEDYYFIAMEYVDGVDLGRLIRQAKARPVPFVYAARIMADVCSGLNYAHNVEDAQGRKLNLVHRDITPQNVLVTYDGVVKVVDFGIAKAAFAAGRTRPGVVKGKFAYMSPEQVEGRSLDGRSDVFSIGICMYELLTGVPLFRRDDVTAAMREIRDGKPILPEKFRPDIPDALVSIMRKALATSRDSRYGSASAMQLDLERYLKAADALGTSHQLGEYLKREHPRPPGEDTSGGVPALRAEGTEAQPQGTRAQPQGTQVQAKGSAMLAKRDPTPPPGALTDPIAYDDMERAMLDDAVDDLAITTPGKGLKERIDDTEDQPTSAFDGPKSGGTAVVPPLGSNRRAVVAAAVAAATVMVVGLLAFRPWRSQAAAPDPIIVPIPAPEPREPITTQLVPPSEPPAPTPHPQPLPAAPPALDILSRPGGARVTIDGRLLAASTPVRGERLATGMHRVLVDRHGFQARELAVQLGDGEHRTLDVELRALQHKGKPAPSKPTGYLTVRTVPWAKVFEGARLLGTTPMANVPLSEGTHVITFVNPELPPVKRTVAIQQGEETRLSLEIKK